MEDCKKLKYGLLSYETKNIGDEIQSLAARNFLPKVDLFLDRDYLNKVKSNKKIKIILNGWFSEKPKNWPPSRDIEPLFVSFHISQKNVKEMTSRKSIKYLKKHEPIGCRDYYTRDLLKKNGVKAYFSGCLTLTLQNKKSKKSDEILLVDLSLAGIKIRDLPKELIKKSNVLSHFTFKASYINIKIAKMRETIGKLFPHIYNAMETTKVNWIINRAIKQTNNTQKKFEMAKKYLERYAKAKLVITSRLHCALPCLAFGTPVIFVHKNLDDPRFGGLKDYLKCYTPQEFKKEINKIDCKSHSSNPKNIRKIKNNLIRTVRDFINH